MCAGLAITAATAFAVACSPSLVPTIFDQPADLLVLVIAQFGIVVHAVGARADELAASTASALFIAYSALTGVTLSFVLLAYTGESVAHDVRRHGRDVRRAGGLRHGDAAQPRGLGPVPLHGAHRRRAGVDRRDLLAQRRPAVRDLVRRRDRLHGPRRLRRAAAEGDGARRRRADRPGRTRSSARWRSTSTSSTCSCSCCGSSATAATRPARARRVPAAHGGRIRTAPPSSAAVSLRGTSRAPVPSTRVATPVE